MYPTRPPTPPPPGLNQVYRSIKFSKVHERSRAAEIERIEQEMLSARSTRGGAGRLRSAAQAVLATGARAPLPPLPVTADWTMSPPPVGPPARTPGGGGGGGSRSALPPPPPPPLAPSALAGDWDVGGRGPRGGASGSGSARGRLGVAKAGSGGSPMRSPRAAAGDQGSRGAAAPEPTREAPSVVVAGPDGPTGTAQ